MTGVGDPKNSTLVVPAVEIEFLIASQKNIYTYVIFLLDNADNYLLSSHNPFTELFAHFCLLFTFSSKTSTARSQSHAKTQDEPKVVYDREMAYMTRLPDFPWYPRVRRIGMAGCRGWSSGEES